MKKYYLLLFTFFVFIGIFAQDIGFSKFLFQEEDYFRTITELKNIIFTDSLCDSMKIYNLIGVSYLGMHDLDNAELYFKKFMDSDTNAYNNYFLTLFLKNDMNGIINSGDYKTEKSKNILLLANLFLDKYKKDEIHSNNKEVQTIIDNYFLLKRKNPIIAGLLSMFLPSSGRFYTERNADGFFSLVTIIIPASIAYYYYKIGNNIALYTALGFTALFYLGDIYGAINSAKIYFPSYKKVYYEKIINSNYYSIFTPDYSF